MGRKPDQELSANQEKWRIVCGFTHNHIKYNIGEPVPELTESERALLFATGCLGRESDGRIIRKIDYVMLSDDDVRRLSELPSNILAERISVLRNIHPLSLRSLLTIMLENNHRTYPEMLIGFINRQITDLEATL